MDRSFGSVIKEYYKNYGDYINAFRSFPLDVDGLKPVERRVLVTLHRVARDKFVKSAKVVGATIATLHPHGDQACYGALVQLVKNGFVDGQGNWGSDVGKEGTQAAAFRYTECKLNSTTEDMALKMLSHVPWKESELDDEPEFLPAMLPFCLMGRNPTIGIGFGYRCLFPVYKRKDLYKRLLFLLGKGSKTIISPDLNCKILSTNRFSEKLLKTGKATIEVSGILEFNDSEHNIILKSWQFDKTFDSIQKKVDKKTKFITTGEVGVYDNSSEETNIVFQVVRTRNKNDIYNRLKEVLVEAVKGSISFSCTTVDSNGKVKIKPVDNFLLDTFNNYKSVKKTKLDTDIDLCNQKIEELDLLKKIRPSLHECLRNRELRDNINKSIIHINKKSGVSKNKIKDLLSKYKISSLLVMKDNREEIMKKIEVIKDDLENLEEVVLEEIKQCI